MLKPFPFEIGKKGGGGGGGGGGQKKQRAQIEGFHEVG